MPRHVLGRGLTPPSEKLNIAGIGIGGQGGGVLRDMATENIVALCDVDSNKAADTFKRLPEGRDSSATTACSWTSGRTSTR